VLRAIRHARWPAFAVAFVALVAVGATSARAIASSIALRQAPSPSVTVTPTVGGPETTFVFSYITPDGLGHRHDLVTHADIRGETTGTGGAKDADCRASFVVGVPSGVPDTPAGRRVSARARPGVGWCAGTYHGEVVETRHQGCATSPGSCTPRVRVSVTTLARFSFRVT
jgi:hypothetical protein